mmetsp:Transcript_15877/g.41797  ORF Transcript_15877/g.41797 Transcript_15877/m.41797 type:complete len:219 (+) Transcript_15877:1295-1951(+)
MVPSKLDTSCSNMSSTPERNILRYHWVKLSISKSHCFSMVLSVAKKMSSATILTTLTLSSPFRNQYCRSRAIPSCAASWRSSASAELDEGVRAEHRGEGPPGSLPAGCFSWMWTKGPNRPSTTGYAAPSSSKGWPVWLGLQGMLQGHHCPSVSFPMGPALKPGSPGMHPTWISRSIAARQRGGMPSGVPGCTMSGSTRIGPSTFTCLTICCWIPSETT